MKLLPLKLTKKVYIRVNFKGVEMKQLAFASPRTTVMFVRLSRPIEVD